VQEILEYYRRRRYLPIRIFYGDTNTGQDWGEEHGIRGYIGRSTGTRPIPLLIANTRALGGEAILDNCIVKLMDVRTRRVLYQHPRYHTAEYTIREISQRDEQDELYTAAVYADGKNVAHFKSMERAKNWVAFMKGERMRSW